VVKWQTRCLQEAVVERLCRFKSGLGHNVKDEGGRMKDERGLLVSFHDFYF
jgi:hypothetical protein